jgi:hypothetical protein
MTSLDQGKGSKSLVIHGSKLVSIFVQHEIDRQRTKLIEICGNTCVMTMKSKACVLHPFILMQSLFANVIVYGDKQYGS